MIINKRGLLDILFINKNTSLNYEINEKFLILSQENKNNIIMEIDFKPFYLSANFNYEGLSSKNLFNKDSFY